VVASSELEGAVAYYRGQAATVVELGIGSTTSSLDLIEDLRRVLPLPSWCGSSWDSIDDAVTEVANGWRFPLLLVVHGLETLLKNDLHLALNTVLSLAGLSTAFGEMELQMVVLYVKEL
jgi:hypothetical protein